METSFIVYNLLHELLVPLHGLARACTILKDEGVAEVAVQVNDASAASSRMLDEVQSLYRNPSERISLTSPEVAAAQFRQLATEWKGYVLNILNAVQQIRDIRRAGFRIEDPELDTILERSLLGGTKRLEIFLSHLEKIETENLVKWDNEWVLNALFGSVDEQQDTEQNSTEATRD